MPVRKTTGNSSPLAVCSVISVTMPPCSSPSGIWSASATSATRSRKSASVPSGVAPSNSRATETISCRFSTRVTSCRSSDALQRRLVPGPVEHRLDQLGDRAARRGLLAQVVDQRVEPGDRRRRPRREAGHLGRRRQRLRERDPLPGRVAGDVLLRPLPDTALGHVEHPAQRHLVGRVGDQPQVGEEVADLAPLVEADAADHPVRQPDPDEDFLEDTGLGVGPVEDRDLAGDRQALVVQPVDLLGDERRLVVLVVGDVADDRRAVAGVGPEVLGLAARVPRHHRVRRGQDVLRGAVVLLEQDHRRVRVVLLELDDVPDRRAAERVDGLVRVADNAQLGRALTRIGIGCRIGRATVRSDRRKGNCRRIPARGPGRTARGWCPGTHPPGHA